MKTPEEIGIEAKKNMDEQVYRCKCMPLGKNNYCEDCHKVVINFMDEYGLGNLEQDILIEKLNKQINLLDGKVNNLNKALKAEREETNKKVEWLKEEINNVSRFDGGDYKKTKKITMLR